MKQKKIISTMILLNKQMNHLILRLKSQELLPLLIEVRY